MNKTESSLIHDYVGYISRNDARDRERMVRTFTTYV